MIRETPRAACSPNRYSDVPRCSVLVITGSHWSKRAHIVVVVPFFGEESLSIVLFGTRENAMPFPLFQNGTVP